MKKIVFWLVLIIGIIAVVGSCSKEEESTTTPTTTGSSRAGSISFEGQPCPVRDYGSLVIMPGLVDTNVSL